MTDERSGLQIAGKILMEGHRQRDQNVIRELEAERDRWRDRCTERDAAYEAAAQEVERLREAIKRAPCPIHKAPCVDDRGGDDCACWNCACWKRAALNTEKGAEAAFSVLQDDA